MSKSTLYLIRHARPAFWHNFRFGQILTSKECTALSKEYDNSTIAIKTLPNNQIFDQIRMCSKLYTSTLTRAVDTGALFNHPNTEALSIFNEAEIPNNNNENLKLPLFAWLFIRRFKWFLGSEKNCESFTDFKVRMEQAARFLTEEIQTHTSIAVVAHGFTNRFLSAYLKKCNWTMIGLQRKAFLGVTRFVYTEQ